MFCSNFADYIINGKMRSKVIRINYYKLILQATLVAFVAALLATLVKKAVEHSEEIVFHQVRHWPYLLLILPSVGITFIYFTRKYLFKGKQNKGIKEIYRTVANRKDDLPLYKIPSHYINGFATVVMGGSTGIEVSTVVASAAVGASAYKNSSVANSLKLEMICAGVAAGVSALFGSPIVGFLFAIEVIAKKMSKTVLLSTAIASVIGWLFVLVFSGQPLFSQAVTFWKPEALPFMFMLCLLGGLVAVFFTKFVIFAKQFFGSINNNFIRVNLGALLVGISIFYFPQLFGDSYHALPELMKQVSGKTFSLGVIGLLCALVLLKPIVASLTLGAGGDGGVFAPSIVAGAILGMLVATFCNHYFGTHLIILNFALIGAAAVLSAAIHAPLTAAFLACSIVPNGYILFIPLLGGAFVAKYAAKLMCNYTVYTYAAHKN